MRRGIAVLVVAAALSGCSGGDGTPDRPVSRVTLGTVDQETFTGCPPITGETVGDGDRLLVAGPAGLTGAGVSPRDRNGLASACLIQRWTPELAEQFERAFPTWSPRPTRR